MTLNEYIMDYGDEKTKAHGAKVIEQQLENIKNDLVKDKAKALYCTDERRRTGLPVLRNSLIWSLLLIMGGSFLLRKCQKLNEN